MRLSPFAFKPIFWFNLLANAMREILYPVLVVAGTGCCSDCCAILTRRHAASQGATVGATHEGEKNPAIILSADGYVSPAQKKPIDNLECDSFFLTQRFFIVNS